MAPKSASKPAKASGVEAGPAEPTLPVLTRTDLPKDRRNQIHQACQILYQREVLDADTKEVTKMQALEHFAAAFKKSLDKAFDPHYMVIAGKYESFACKNRKKTMAMWKVGDNGVMIWKSPALEPQMEDRVFPTDRRGENTVVIRLEVDTAKDAAAAHGKLPEKLAEKGITKDQMAGEPVVTYIDNANGKVVSVKGPADLKGVEIPGQVKFVVKLKEIKTPVPEVTVLVPEELEKGSDKAKVIELLKAALAATPKQDSLEVVKLWRKSLTKELGTIWHIVIGQDFISEIPEDAEHFVRAKISSKDRKDRTVACWQHSQFDRAWSFTDVKPLLRFAPYLLCVLFGLAYMTLNSICGDDKRPGELNGFQSRMRESFCGPNWEYYVMCLAASALGMVILRRTKMLDKWTEPRIQVAKKND